MSSNIKFVRTDTGYARFTTYDEQDMHDLRGSSACPKCVLCCTKFCSLAPCEGGIFITAKKDDPDLPLAILRGDV